ncbi:MAG TPA: helix-turn-helix domain-containing protein [Iamia sp.]|nr:helix-turn-helix domain-containing protein [Iamia sp.]
MQEVEHEQADAVRALGHPIRLRILGHLWRHGASTVTDIARAEGLSTASVSYHAQRLAKARFIERADELAAGKEKPWRTIQGPYTASNEGSDPDVVRSMREAIISADGRRVRNLMADWPSIPAEWQMASFFATRGFFLTSDELTRVIQVLLETLRPFESRTHADKPEEAKAVRLMLYGFPETDGPAGDETGPPDDDMEPDDEPGPDD